MLHLKSTDRPSAKECALKIKTLREWKANEAQMMQTNPGVALLLEAANAEDKAAVAQMLANGMASDERLVSYFFHHVHIFNRPHSPFG